MESLELPHEPSPAAQSQRRTIRCKNGGTKHCQHVENDTSCYSLQQSTLIIIIITITISIVIIITIIIRTSASSPVFDFAKWPSAQMQSRVNITVKWPTILQTNTVFCYTRLSGQMYTMHLKQLCNHLYHTPVSFWGKFKFTLALRPQRP